YANEMFKNASSFDRHLINWDVSDIKNMESMFDGASAFGSTAADDYLSSWEVSSVENMDAMFEDASKLDQYVCESPLHSLGTAPHMFDNSGLRCENCSGTSEGWAIASSTAFGGDFGAAGITYCTAVIPAHQELDYNKNWDISD